VDQPLDLKGRFDIPAAVKALARTTFAGLELGKLGFPEAQHVGFDFTDACNVANFELEAVRNGGCFVDALGGELRDHKNPRRARLTARNRR